MVDSYVCSGATMKCSMGTSQAKLTVLPSRTVFLTGQPMANISDHLSMVNLAPFGRCRSLGFPATASATAAAHGKLTPMPCMHNTPFPWMNGKNDYIVKGDPALLKSSTCSCMWGGTISITDDGQHGEGTQWVQKKEKEEFDSSQEAGDFADNANYSDPQAQTNRIVNSYREQNKTVSKKIQPHTADLVLPNFSKYPPNVQERILKMADEMPDCLNLQEKLKLSEHNFRIEKSLGIRKGPRMSIAQADKQSANPKYKKDTPYSVNCATTAAAYVLRRHGFDVKAKGNSDKNPLNKWLSESNSFKIWKNVDGTEAKPITTTDWMKLKSTKELPIEKMTPALYKKYIEENTKEEGVYILTLKWKEETIVNPDGTKTKKGGGGHTTIIQRWKDKSGKLHLSRIEPQVYNEKVGTTRSVDELCKHLDPDPPKEKGIMRVDNKMFDTKYSSLFEK